MRRDEILEFYDVSIASTDEVVKPLKLFQELVFEIVGEPVPKLAWLHLGDRVAGRKTDLPRSPSSNQTVHAVWLLPAALHNLRKFVNKNYVWTCFIVPQTKVSQIEYHWK